MDDSILEIHDLRKSFKKVEALRGLTLNVPRGSVCGFLGKNGAGKTTTIKILLGMARPDSGSAQVFGLDASHPEQSLKIRRRLGFVSETKELYPYMTVEQVIRFTRPFFPAWRRDLEAHYLKAFELPLDRNITKLSKGMRSKLMLLLALARGAELLILDEPTDGLDPAMVEDVLQAIVSLAAQQEVTIFFSSHQLAEVEQIADRVCIIDQGRTVLNDQLDELRANYRRVQLVFERESQRPQLAIPGVERLEQSGRTVSLLVSRNVNLVIEKAKREQPLSIDVHPVSLKEIFLETVRVKA